MSDSQLITSVVGSIDVGDVSNLTAMFLYNGYSPELVFRHLAKIRKDDPKITDADFRQDMKTLVVMGVVMGNYSEKSSKGISDAGKAMGDALFKKYSLKVGGVQGDKKAITLPRLMSAFPIVTSKFIDKIGGKTYSNAFSCGDLPNVLRSAVLPAIIPKSLPSSVRSTLMLIATCYSAEQTMTITGNTDAMASYEIQKKYSDLAHRGPVPSETERSAYIGSLVLEYEALKKVVDAFVAVSKKPFVIATKAEFTLAGIHTS